MLENIPPEVLQWGPLVLMAVVFYALLLRPQQQQRKQRDAMLKNLQKGDKIVTVGGMHGTIIGFSGDTLTLRAADKVELVFNRSAVGQVLKPIKGE